MVSRGNKKEVLSVVQMNMNIYQQQQQSGCHGAISLPDSSCLRSSHLLWFSLNIWRLVGLFVFFPSLSTQNWGITSEAPLSEHRGPRNVICDWLQTGQDPWKVWEPLTSVCCFGEGWHSGLDETRQESNTTLVHQWWGVKVCRCSQELQTKGSPDVAGW